MRIKNRLTVATLTALLALGLTAPAATAATYDGTIIQDGRYIVKVQATKATLSFQVGCSSFWDSPYVGVYAVKTGHTNRPILISLDASGGKGWGDEANYRGDALLNKSIGETAYTSLVALKPNGTAWNTRPEGTMTVTLQQVDKYGTPVGDPEVVEVPRPKVNCQSVGGAVLESDD